MVEVNLLGAMAWMNLAAARFEAARARHDRRHLERRRRSRPPQEPGVYGHAKARSRRYLEALRNRCARYGVNVVTVKPGFVDTDDDEGPARALLADLRRRSRAPHPAPGRAAQQRVGLRAGALGARDVHRPQHPVVRLPPPELLMADAAPSPDAARRRAGGRRAGADRCATRRLARARRLWRRRARGVALRRAASGEELADLLASARREGLSVTFRGAGRSYGDAALNTGGARRRSARPQSRPPAGIRRRA